MLQQVEPKMNFLHQIRKPRLSDIELIAIDLTQASIHDIHYLKNIKQTYQDCTILGDKGYLSIDYQRDLFLSSRIKLEVPMRKNQDNYKPQAYIFRKSRK